MIKKLKQKHDEFINENDILIILFGYFVSVLMLFAILFVPVVFAAMIISESSTEKIECIENVHP